MYNKHLKRMKRKVTFLKGHFNRKLMLIVNMQFIIVTLKNKTNTNWHLIILMFIYNFNRLN